MNLLAIGSGLIKIKLLPLTLAIMIPAFLQVDTCYAAEDATSWIGVYKLLGEDEYLISITKDYFIICEGKNISAFRYKRVNDDLIQLKTYFDPVYVKIRAENDTLFITKNDRTDKFRKSADHPDDVNIDPIMGNRSPNEPELEKIKAELTKRFTADVDVRKETLKATGGRRDQTAMASAEAQKAFERMLKVDRENVSWLLKNVNEFGWLDAKRFGAKPAEAAFYIALHSRHLRLMRTAEQSLRAQVDAKLVQEQLYAAMADRLNVMLQQPMHYGIQATSDATGQMVLPIIKDRQKLNANRKRIGEPPLEDFVKTMEAKKQSVRVLELDE